MAYLEVISGDLKGSTIPLSSLGIHIGRDSKNGVCAPNDPSLGRRHASILPKGGGWVCVDHGSVAGTFVDDVQVGVGPAPLLEGSTIRCGLQTFRIWGLIQTRPQVISSIELEVLHLIQLRQAAKRADPDLPAKVQTAAPAPGYAIPPPPDVEARTPGSLSEAGRGGRPVLWWGADEPVDVGRKRIPVPMFYLGPADAAPWVVDDFLYVAQFNAVGTRIAWPAAYATFDASERAGYLSWLAGRRLGAAPEAYLLLFLNGLDQRLGELLAPAKPEHGAKCAEERVRIATEIERLLTRNSVAPRFQSYARSLLSELWVEKPANLRFGSLPAEVVSGDDPAFLWAAACLAQSFAKFTVEHAAQWRAGRQRILRSRVTSEMTLPYLNRFIELRVNEFVGSGWDLTPSSGTTVEAPAPELSGIRLCDRPRRSLPGAEEAPALLQRLLEIEEVALKELEPMARRLGRRPSAVDLARAPLHLPQELFLEHSLAGRLKSALKANPDSIITLKPFLRDLSLGDSPLNQDLDAFVQACRSVGYRVEPLNVAGAGYERRGPMFSVHRLSPPAKPPSKAPAKPRTKPQPRSPAPPPPPAPLDLDRIRSTVEETRQVARVLGEVFVEEDSAGPAPPSAAVEQGLDALLRSLKPGVISRAELAALSRAHGLAMVGAVIDALNERSLDLCDELLFEGEDPVDIDASVLETIRSSEGSGAGA